MTWLVIDARTHRLLTFGDEAEVDDFMKTYQENFVGRPVFKTPLMIGIEIHDFDLTGAVQAISALDDYQSSETSTRDKDE